MNSLTPEQLAFRAGYEQGRFDAQVEQETRPYRLLQNNGSKYFGESWDKPEQPAQQEPVAWLSRDDARLALWDAINKREFGNPTDDKLILDHLRKNGLWIGKYTSPPASKPLSPQPPCEMTQAENKMFRLGWLECEAAHGITGESK